MKYLNENKLQDIFKKINGASIGLIADFCVDIYWHADMTISELSRETPHFPLPIVNERMSLGAGGNVGANLKAIGLKNVYAVTVCGNDWRGGLAAKLVKEAGIDERFIVTSDNFVTSAYCKPLRKGISNTVYEDPRLDFENGEPITKKDETALINNISEMAKLADVVVVSDQFKYGVITEKVREHICALAKTKTVIVDSRDRIALYGSIIAKPNEAELFRVFNPGVIRENIDDGIITELGAKLQKKNSRPLIVTVGARGAFLFDNGKYELFETAPEKPPIDIVGAGEAFISAVSACRAAGADWKLCIETAHLATGVTIKKLNTTGTASQNEISQKFKERTK